MLIITLFNNYCIVYAVCMTDFQCLINKSIKNLRLSKGLSQEKFSEMCGLSSDNYRNLEYNRHSPKSSTVDKICDTFNLTPVQLLRYGEGQPSLDEQLTDALVGLSDEQTNLVKDFIGLIGKYNL